MIVFGLRNREHKEYIVTCKGCRRDVPAGVRKFPFQSIDVSCPLCGEQNAYRPSDVSLGFANSLVAKQAKAEA
jgi:predicted RNA-binding Zn-ribbon protein involved in translation (DUF1610 family)